MLDVVGPAEIAVMFGVTRVTVNRWQTEHTLPDPDARLSRGPLWLRVSIVEWAEDTGRLITDA
jgi:hypothetical protein